MLGLILTPQFLVGYFAACVVIALLGRGRSMGPWGYFFGSIVLTPVIGLLLLLASGPRRTQ